MIATATICKIEAGFNIFSIDLIKWQDKRFRMFFFYLTKRTKRSERLQCSGACGAIGASADIMADSGAHLASATSKMQSHSATTKFSLANVSLCERSSSVSTGKSGALNKQGTFHTSVAQWNVCSVNVSLAMCLDNSPPTDRISTKVSGRVFLLVLFTWAVSQICHSNITLL